MHTTRTAQRSQPAGHCDGNSKDVRLYVATIETVEQGLCHWALPLIVLLALLEQSLQLSQIRKLSKEYTYFRADLRTMPTDSHTSRLAKSWVAGMQEVAVVFQQSFFQVALASNLLDH